VDSQRGAESPPTGSRHDLAVIGLGYVGLQLARQVSRSGLSVTGLDINATTVDGLNAGRSHIDDLSDDDVGAMVAADVLRRLVVHAPTFSH
jgi:UDP-N-acetyl-D-mannosaminuronate dehydrogenase